MQQECKLDSAMPLNEASLKRHLLDTLASPPNTLHSAHHLTPENWQAWLDIASMHRLGPLLHWQQSQAPSATGWPEAIVSSLAQMRRQHAMRSLQMQRELLHAHRLLREAGIPYMALKGAFLAWHAYPQPGLRPVRDLDILVPIKLVLKAYEVLQAGGFEKTPGEHGHDHVILESEKHLPSIMRAGGGLSIELHARLSHPGPDGGQNHDLCLQHGFWDRTIYRPLAGEAISYPCQTDQLLHLLVHAVVDHKLNNGPLIFTDVYYLLLQHNIDWPLFWQQADAIRQRPAVTLGLHLVMHQLRASDIAWPDMPSPAPDTELLDTLRNFSLRDFSTRSGINLAHQLTFSRSHLLTLLRQELLPSIKELAGKYPTSKMVWTLPYWYARKWLDSLMRIIEIFRTRRDMAAIKSELSALRQLDSWLKNNASHPTPRDKIGE